MKSYMEETIVSQNHNNSKKGILRPILSTKQGPALGRHQEGTGQLMTKQGTASGRHQEGTGRYQEGTGRNQDATSQLATNLREGNVQVRKITLDTKNRKNTRSPAAATQQATHTPQQTPSNNTP